MLSHPARSRGTLGFTLLELVVAISLFALLITIATPTFAIWVQSAKVRSVGEALQNDLRLAQGEALRRNRQVQFSLISSPGASTPSIYNATISPGGLTPTTPATNWMAFVLPQVAGDAQTASTTQQFVAGGDNGALTSQVQIAGALGASGGTGNATITFTPFGRLANQTQTQVYTLTPSNAAARTLAVTVSLGGAVRLCDPSRSITTAPDGC